jgi:DNA processing protein
LRRATSYRKIEHTFVTLGESPLMDQLMRLTCAVAATRRGARPARLVDQVRRVGVEAFTTLLDSLDRAEREAVEAEARALSRKQIAATLIGDAGYPTTLGSLTGAPPALFHTGAAGLLGAAGLGVCGSRRAGPEGMRAAGACGAVAAEQGMSVVSGYARGVDTAAHVSALEHGGSTVLVLPEGIDRFTVKPELARAWDVERVLVVSQFAPRQPWSAGAAMARNTVIYGMSAALVVVEAGETGGTLAAGRAALTAGRPVLALEFAEIAPGNRMLLAQGAEAIGSREELSAVVARLSPPAPAAQQLNLL